MPHSRIDSLQRVEPYDRAEWRDWLMHNHAGSRGVWLAIGKVGNNVTSLTYDSAVEEALCFGWIDSVVRRLDSDRFLQLMTPRKPGSGWAQSNKKRVERLIASGAMQPAGLRVIQAAKEDGSWNLYDRVEALAIPDDLATALRKRKGAEPRFNELPESSRKLALYWIATAKRPETRERRIAETVRAAVEGRAPR